MEEQLAKFFAGEANEDERREVLAWRGASAENADEFIEAKTAWMASSRPIESNELILTEILRKPAAKVVGWPPYLKYVAAVVLMAMISALWYYNRTIFEEPNVLVFNGSYQELEDGTLVSLRKGSTLEVIEFSDNLRKVKISGKAFFEVKRDENRPFEVITKDATVRVLGTSFQVLGEADYTEVCVESGLVSLAKNNSRNKMSLNLSKGEMGIIRNSSQGIVKRKIIDKNFLSWKNGVLNFEGTKASEVVKTINDAYNANVTLPASLNNCRLTAQFNQKNLEEIIQILSATFNWTYEINQDKVVLIGTGC